MKSNNSIAYQLLLLSSLFFINFTCHDCEDTLTDRSNFSVIPSTSQNTFSIGDTLFLSTHFSTQMELEFSGTVYDNSNQLVNYTMKLFEGTNVNNTSIEARDNFEFLNSIGFVSFPYSRTFEIVPENRCDEDLCELEFGIIPQKKGYFGIMLRSGRFGYEDNSCQSLSLMPTEIESNGNNNFEIFNEIGLSTIRIEGSFFRNPESEALLYFFKVIE